MLALVAPAAGLLALLALTGVAHPWHAAGAVTAFAVIYLAVGVLIGSLVEDPLEGSLSVTFVFLLDVFSGPGMTADAAPCSISRSPSGSGLVRRAHPSMLRGSRPRDTRSSHPDGR